MALFGGVMTDPRILGTRQVIEALLPGSTFHESNLPEAEFREFHKNHRYNDHHDFGTIIDGGTIYFWQRLSNNRRLHFKIHRAPIKITKRERQILLSFEKTQRGLVTSNQSRAAVTTSRMASYNAFGDILISRYLRGHDAANFWTASLIVSELQALSLQRYEGSACTSGIIFVREPDLVLSKIDPNVYIIEDLGDFTFDVGFFSLPPTFRYVDGKNAFYIVDNWRRVRGVLRLRNPGSFPLHARAAYKHLDPLFAVPAGRMFVAAVGNYGYVTVQSRNGLQLRWQAMFWSVTDQKLFVQILEKFGLHHALAEKLTFCCLAISDMRIGALLLIVPNEGARPSSAGDIGDVGISTGLKRVARGKMISDAIDTNEAVGILTSDGLTTIDCGGRILGAGEIINLQVAGGAQISGGGRTQAAITASNYGLAIKISEDGPISLFRDGKPQIKFSR